MSSDSGDTDILDFINDSIEAPNNTKQDIRATLEKAYVQAEYIFNNNTRPSLDISSVFRNALDGMHFSVSKASTGFTNVVTGLVIKATLPHIDTRYHQVQIQNPKYFNFRGISEDVVYPWLKSKDFDGAKSGWQTRTFERPKPYTYAFSENIKYVKQHFLTCYEEMQDPSNVVFDGLTHLLWRQIQSREEKRIDLAQPSINDIVRIINYLDLHLSHRYSGKGVSRLPVLMIYAIYMAMVPELRRFNEKELRPLQSHSAADSQTGSAGDIEVEHRDGKLFEAIEIKHNIKITEDMVSDITRKIAHHGLQRYYILTTHPDCKPDDSLQKLLKEIKDRIGCQIIVNGVIPTIHYYLRLLVDPSAIFKPYTDLLSTDKAISHEHRVTWNDIVAGKIT